MKTKAEIMKDLATVRRRKITIQKKNIKGKDDIGNELFNWVDWKTLWVKRNELFGTEYFSAKVHNEENTLEFIAKYVDFIRDINSIDYQVIFDNKAYDIKKIDYLQDDGSFVKFRCLKRGA